MPAETKPDPSTTSLELLFGARYQTDYNSRGVSQSNRNGSFQTYAELQLLDNLFYLGFATQQVDLVTRPPVEQDFTGGFRPKVGPLRFDFGFLYYNYPREHRLIDQIGKIYTPANTDFYELVAKVSGTYQDTIALVGNVFHSGNWAGTHAAGTYGSVTAKYAIPETLLGVPGLALSGELGHFWLGTTSPQLGSIQLPDYTYFNAGLSYTWKVFTFDVRYHTTNLSEQNCYILTADPSGAVTRSQRSTWCGSALIVTLSVEFAGSAIPAIRRWASD